MNYNMDGRFVMSLYIENYHNDLKSKDPKALFMEKIKSSLAKEGIDCDWIECQDCQVEVIKDYTEEVNKALYNSGYGVKVIEMPKLVNKGIPSITKMAGEVQLWRCQLNNNKNIVVLIHGGKVFLPCNPLNYFLVFDSDCCEATKIKQPNDVFRYYWIDNNDVYAIINDGTFMCIYNSESKYNPVIGQRLANVRAKIDDDVYVIHSTIRELNLASVNEENVAYDAYFDEDTDTMPTNITMTKLIL